MTIESPAAPLLRHLLAPIAPFLEQEGVEDIAFNRPSEAWVRARGAWTQHFFSLDYQDLESIAILAGALRHQDVGANNPILDTELPGGERLHVSMPPTTPVGTVSLTFRKPGSEVASSSALQTRYRIDADWNHTTRDRSGIHDGELLSLYRAGDITSFLVGCVRARQNIVFVGKVGSGKTSLLKTLIAEIDPSERIVTVEDALELVVPQPNHVRLLFQRNDLDETRIDSETLLQGTLRMRPDRVLLGEVRGKEAWTFVNEVTPAFPGTLSSIHGHDHASGMKRLYALCNANDAAPRDAETLRIFVAAAVDVIVPMYQEAGVFSVGQVWFRADAEERGGSAADLLRES